MDSVDRRLLENRTLEERRARELMILLCFDVIGGSLDVHEATDSKYHEHECKLMGEQRVINGWRGVRAVKLVIDVLIKLVEGDHVVPVNAIRGHPECSPRRQHSHPCYEFN